MDLSKSWPYITQIARLRLENNVTERHVADYGEEIEIMGAAGELAALKELGLPERLHIQFDGGVDFEFRGYTVDVKTTKLTPKLNYRFLQWAYHKKLTADLILMAAVDVEQQSAIVVGYATREEMLKAEMNYTRKTPCREIPVERLGRIWELMMFKEKGFDRTLREREFARRLQLSA